MKLEYIEDLIYKNNIKLINAHLENTKGAYISYMGLNTILYDNKQIDTSYIKKEVLAEEFAHYSVGATYRFNSDKTYINKQEYRAKKLVYYNLIPYEDLKSAIFNRHRYNL